MSEPILLIVNGPDGKSLHDTVRITPDIASQIVALALDIQQDAKPYFCPGCGKECKTWFDRTLDADGDMATRCEHCGCDVDKATKHADIEAEDRSCGVAKPDADCRVVSVSSRMCERGTKGCVVAHDKPEPVAKPDADEAAVDAIEDAIIEAEWQHGTGLTSRQMKAFGRFILTAIRAGKVPGVWWYNEDGMVPVMQEKNDQIRHLKSELTDLRLDVWGQYALDMGDGWQSDGALSTLESIADDLMDSGVFERHPERPWYRVRAPNQRGQPAATERSWPTADAVSTTDVGGSADAKLLDSESLTEK